MLIDVGDLRLGERDGGPGEVRAAVLARRILEQPEEIIRQVVVRLDVLEMGGRMSLVSVASGMSVRAFLILLIYLHHGPPRT